MGENRCDGMGRIRRTPCYRIEARRENRDRGDDYRPNTKRHLLRLCCQWYVFRFRQTLTIAGMNLTYKNMVEDGSITQEEYNNTNINAYHRSREEFLEPFPKHSFEVDSTEVIRLNDPHTEEYRQTKDKETYCSRLVGFFQSWSEASIISGLSEKRTKEEKHQISDKFYARFKSWMLDHCEDPEFLATCFGIYIVIRATYNPRSQA